MSISGAAALLSLVPLLTVLASTANAQTNLVQNGSFAVTGGTTSFQFGTFDGYTPTETLADWSSTGYNFVFLPTSTSANSVYGTANLTLYSSTTSPSNSFNNASPTGGNFIGADADYGTEPITQTINGLKPGATYAVSFAWAAAQQAGYTGPTTEQWEVNLGSNAATTQDTKVVDNVSTGFSGWMDQTFDFVATAPSEVLSFLANGTPAGVPPFALLANVSMTQVPEPASLTVMAAGLAGLIVAARRRRGSRQTDT
jgi:PEP-CTERM motif